MLPPEALEVVERVDVVQGISVKCTRKILRFFQEIKMDPIFLPVIGLRQQPGLASLFKQPPH